MEEKLQPTKTNLDLKNRAIRYGDGLFESIRIKDFKPQFLDDHFVRLKSGCKTIGIETGDSLKSIQNEINSLAKNFQNAILRLSIIRKPGGKYLPTNNRFDYIIEIQEFNPDLHKSTMDRIGIYTKNQKPISDYGRYKTISSMLYILASLFAEEKNLDDALLQNTNGNIIEATSSNLFIRKGPKIITPPLSDGPIEGILRKQILGLKNLTPYYICEESISESDLADADEIFLTNSIKGVVSVRFYKNKIYENIFANFLKLKILELN